MGQKKQSGRIRHRWETIYRVLNRRLGFQPVFCSQAGSLSYVVEKKEFETMDIAEVRKVASLARLTLNAQELAACGEQLTVILDYVSLLNEVDTTDVAPMSHPIPAENIFRDDVQKDSLPREAALANSPKTDGLFFLVPKILEEKGA